MTENPLTQLRENLIEVLSTIRSENGHFTDAGLSVRSGWYHEVIQTEKHRGPLIVVQPGTDHSPEQEAGQLVLNPGYLIIAAVNAGFDGYESALDDLEYDIYSTLAQKGIRSVPWTTLRAYQMKFGDPAKAPPGGGTNWASLAIPVNFKIIINRFDPRG